MTQTLKVKHPGDVPGHAMYGDFALPDRSHSYVSLRDLLSALAPGRRLTAVEFSQIWAKPNYLFGHDDFSGERFERADPKYPGVLVRAMPNPAGLPFRMIDGRRRLEKLRLGGFDGASFLVFDYGEVRPYIYDFEISPDG
ncbi:MAG: hypothetical protein RL120_03620 [Gammaproteobacteria bacterium]